jgi:hypothetical protein
MRAIPLVLFMLLTACMGAVGPSPTPGGDDDDPIDASARELYVSNVHSIMARCGGNSCHAIDATATAAISKYYTTDAGTTYTAIRTPPMVGDFSSIAPILTKIDSGHQAIAYSATERSRILDWLAAELQEQRDNPNLPPPVDPAELLRTFSGCMTQDNFVAAQMPQLFGNASAANGQACKNCHLGGAFGFVTDPNANLYFSTLSSSLSQLVKYFGVTNGQVTINPGAMNNAGSGIPAHPPFITEQLGPNGSGTGYAALQQFYDLTMQAQLAGNCGPPKAINP